MFNMAKRLIDLDLNRTVTRNHLRDLLKADAKNLHMKDIMLAASFLREDAKYMPASYRIDYIERFSKAFFNRIKDLKEDNNDYPGELESRELLEFFKVIDNQSSEAKGKNEKCFVKIAKIIATYTTFVRKEPIHPIGTKFPGGFILRYEDGNYFCPVKKQQINNPSALCRFCVSQQDEKAILKRIK
jgi:uncharacterized protein (UPF0305 family)